ncbi:MAG: hypothetical protein FWF46_08285 [Oscillospiraceae bacterium]|nr:hypothetical protein [Oscillospiraceae bacterium]
MYNLFNSIENSINKSLGKLDAQIHLDRDSKLKNTFVDNFIHELRDYLDRHDSIYKLNTLPPSSKLEINEIEEKYLQCYFDHEPYYIPRDMIDFNSKNEDYHHLQLGQDGLYHYVAK